MQFRHSQAQLINEKLKSLKLELHSGKARSCKLVWKFGTRTLDDVKYRIGKVGQIGSRAQC